MKIYKLWMRCELDGQSVSYHANKADAERTLRRGSPIPDDVTMAHEITAHQIAPTKRDVLRFLHHHTPSHDNG